MAQPIACKVVVRVASLRLSRRPTGRPNAQVELGDEAGDHRHVADVASQFDTFGASGEPTTCRLGR